MRLHQPRIAVIGAGIIGSAITYNLAIRGANVLLLDESPKPGSGVTGRAFGWINVINGTPGHASYALWREAVAEYQLLKSALPEALSDARAGSLTWRATPQETEQLADLHKRAGEDVELLKRSVVAEWEPRLRRVPECAVFSRNDLALDPKRLAGTYVAAALAAGASARFDEKVAAIETANGRVTGIRVSDGTLKADVIVMAAGSATNVLVGELGIDTGIETSPALLLRYTCSMPVVGRILRGPRLEVRQAGDNTLLVAKSYVENGAENGPQAIGERTLAVMKDELDLPDNVMLASAEVGDRPIFADGLPRLGFLPQVHGLYVAAGHPGVILAPLVGRLTAEEIVDGRRNALIPGPK
ncbi:FAD-binding oxidoreductase [Pararhizobium sp. YC-54]|uniref:NAD(P)/FAD-dependent oxidoreductase n=1 Tax=Pararhizobium sp. YC-54 TaxID=2986920 RepID=UPI0021F79517|nr:FAD-dependent oxidoreductase [Pararhizobium sp. YC-54]MCW0000372.1 FAD-binding oxidoreductase [Pararhizobium sp. YC-54]